MQRSRLSVMLVLTLASAIASAEVYKWLDADGNVHYGDRPPATGTDSHSITLPPAPTRDADHERRSLLRSRLLEAIDAERAEQAQAEREAAAAKQERARMCARARGDLARFERANIIYTNDESGARIYMSDEARREATANAKLWIDEHCD
jgi:Domain of unknown function (DUF4124)